MAENAVNVRISVIVPVRDTGPLAVKALRSALRQTAGPKEIIVVDDCSDARTGKLLARIAERHQCVRLMRNGTRRGAGYSRNAALDAARGEFVAFLDSDDIYPDRHSLERMCDKADATGTDVCGGLRELRIDGRIHRSLDFIRNELAEHPEGRVLEYRDYQQDYDFTSYVFRRSLIEKNEIRFPETLRYQDVPFFVRCMAAAGRFSLENVRSYRYTIDSKDPVEYGDRNTEDLVKSMTDVISFAANNRLALLQKRTVERMNEEYGKYIVRNFENGNKNIAELLRSADSAIDRSLPDCENLHVTLLNGSTDTSARILNDITDYKTDNAIKDRIQWPSNPYSG